MKSKPHLPIPKQEHNEHVVGTFCITLRLRPHQGKPSRVPWPHKGIHLMPQCLRYSQLHMVGRCFQARPRARTSVRERNCSQNLKQQYQLEATKRISLHHCSTSAFFVRTEQPVVFKYCPLNRHVVAKKGETSVRRWRRLAADRRV